MVKDFGVAGQERSFIVWVVKVRTSGKLRRIDIQPTLRCIPALLGEWADLRFDGS